VNRDVSFPQKSEPESQAEFRDNVIKQRFRLSLEHSPSGRFNLISEFMSTYSREVARVVLQPMTAHASLFARGLQSLTYYVANTEFNMTYVTQKRGR
jgi:hypothetical protein